ncbi:hypothetical protein [Streptomyces sp. NPDC057623]
MVAAVGATGIVAAKATPHVKKRLNNLKLKLNRTSEDTVEATGPRWCPGR